MPLSLWTIETNVTLNPKYLNLAFDDSRQISLITRGPPRSARACTTRWWLSPTQSITRASCARPLVPAESLKVGALLSKRVKTAVPGAGCRSPSTPAPHFECHLAKRYASFDVWFLIFTILGITGLTYQYGTWNPTAYAFSASRVGVMSSGDSASSSHYGIFFRQAEKNEKGARFRIFNSPESKSSYLYYFSVEVRGDNAAALFVAGLCSEPSGFTRKANGARCSTNPLA